MKWLAAALILVVAACSSSEPADEATPSTRFRPEINVVFNGAELEVGETVAYKYYIHCGMNWLTDFNGSVWYSEDPIWNGRGRYPEELRRFFANPSEQISPELWTHLTLVAGDEISVTLPDGSLESVYRPSEREWPGCA